MVPYLNGPAEPLYLHCKRAIERSFSRFSPRGVPLMGDHDWNDGLSAVGTLMKGESFWGAEFLYMILGSFAPLARQRADERFALKCDQVRADLKTALNRHGWDGQWYLQATTDSGLPLGSSQNEEGKIFLMPNIWAVMSGMADPERSASAMDAVTQYLLKDYGTVLNYPAFTHPRPDVGYVTRYAPGLRENGGVYTHAAAWSVWAYAAAGRAVRANIVGGASAVPPTGPANPDPGSAIGLLFSAADVHLFSSETGSRLDLAAAPSPARARPGS